MTAVQIVALVSKFWIPPHIFPEKKIKEESRSNHHSPRDVEPAEEDTHPRPPRGDHWEARRSRIGKEQCIVR